MKHSLSHLTGLFALYGLPRPWAIAKQLSRQFASLAELVHAPPDVLKLRGASEAQIRAIKDFRSLHLSVLASEALKTTQPLDVEKLKRHLAAEIGHCRIEHFHVVYLSQLKHVIESRTHWSGGYDSTPVYVREIVMTAIILGAAHIILAHNHPSGIAEPSKADRIMTDQICKAARPLDIQVADHWVFAGQAVFSFAEHGLL
ncbi:MULTISPECIES: JAB domain-containing protein [unclassified Sphingobium]|uniref:JAB domain-containing protein n=1 Tax=unclassified Sphingobium TaxID=2611147 RepID=UPI00222519C8|nr:MULTISPECIES: JAB domain-containing protein [unclassified Sphingobium]MCW2382839.1 DNA repair protein RadC [Sphingobium sp. B2D3B]MCW2390170.1 DNA repair protein RadC [Sphingobium sp. B11D3B]MCW2396988.1 DNA repair protein RadC [Sphingobium sp. B2D3C]